MTTIASDRVGLFDSGLGGLTVLKEIRDRGIFANIVYFGDTGRVPYGTRSVDTIIRYAKQDVRFLLTHGVEQIIIACGTVSANALDVLRAEFPVPVDGVIAPSVEAALRATKNGRIGVIGTPATITSGIYERELRAHSAAISVTSVACPLFVPLVEYGFTAEDDPITALTCERYLATFRARGIDTLIMGCTHYPIIERAIGKALPDVTLINNGVAMAESFGGQGKYQTKVEYYVSDDANGFAGSASRFLGGDILPHAEKVDIQEY